MNAKLSIGLVARRTGVTVPTVRYYEEIGLLPPASRTESGQRHYGEATVRRLAFIRRCRDFGFPLEQVRELVALVDDPERPCAEARALAASRLEDVRRKLDELKALETSLAAFVCGCDAACVGGPAVDAPSSRTCPCPHVPLRPTRRAVVRRALPRTMDVSGRDLPEPSSEGHGLHRHRHRH